MSIARIVAMTALAALLLSTAQADAHELWLEPLRPAVAPGEEAAVDVKVGQMLAGATYTYITAYFKVFDFVDSAGCRPVVSTIGDQPAVHEATGDAGLARLVYLSSPDFLTYKTFEQFEAFAQKDGQAAAIARHRERGLPETNFREAYTRSAKALIRVGDGAGADGPLGLPYEVIAEVNPFTASADAPIRAQILWQGAPAPGELAAIFRRAPDGAVALEHRTTDADGRIDIPAGKGFHLISVVRLIEPDPELAARTGVVWHSFWGSLSFHR